MKGCGKQIHVAGTNGGTMPCGATLKHLDGTFTREFCTKCDEREPPHRTGCICADCSGAELTSDND